MSDPSSVPNDLPASLRSLVRVIRNPLDPLAIGLHHADLIERAAEELEWRLRERAELLACTILLPLDRAELAAMLDRLAAHLEAVMPGDDAAANAIGQAQDLLREARVRDGEFDEDEDEGEGESNGE